MNDEIKKKLKFKKKQKKECVYCGCTNKMALTVDHIVPKARGGGDEDSNLQITCWICNQLKGTLTDKEFKKYYKAMQDLHALCKVKFVFPNNLPLKFNEHYYPNLNLWDKKTEVPSKNG